jgi:hypothetical protein
MLPVGLSVGLSVGTREQHPRRTGFAAARGGPRRPAAVMVRVRVNRDSSTAGLPPHPPRRSSGRVWCHHGRLLVGPRPPRRDRPQRTGAAADQVGGRLHRRDTGRRSRPLPVRLDRRPAPGRRQRPGRRERRTPTVHHHPRPLPRRPPHAAAGDRHRSPDRPAPAHLPPRPGQPNPVPRHHRPPADRPAGRGRHRGLLLPPILRRRRPEHDDTGTSSPKSPAGRPGSTARPPAAGFAVYVAIGLLHVALGRDHPDALAPTASPRLQRRPVRRRHRRRPRPPSTTRPINSTPTTTP